MTESTSGRDERERLQRFKIRVREAHPEAFRLHLRAAALLEEALLVDRQHDDALALALDMHMLQAYKAHLSTLVLAEHGHAEDTATMVRRLLELGVQAVYIGGDEFDAVRHRRATNYVADLWCRIPDERRQLFPSDVSQWWDEITSEAEPPAPKRRSWGPSFKAMFEYAEAAETYEQDYRFLSSITHGSSEHQILQYSLETIPIRSVDFAGVLLLYATRYYLVVAEQWNRHFGLLDRQKIEHLMEELAACGQNGAGSSPTAQQ